jgi:hypothetical protein
MIAPVYPCGPRCAATPRVAQALSTGVAWGNAVHGLG